MHENEHDAIVYFQVLEHVGAVGEFISASLRCLRSGGTLIIAVPNEAFNGDKTNAILNMPPHHTARFSKESMESIARLYDLEVVEVLEPEIEPIHYSWHKRNALINAIFGYKLLDTSLPRRVANKLADKLLGKWLNPRGIKGHTIMGVYKKR